MKKTLILAGVLLFALSATAFAQTGAWFKATDQSGAKALVPVVAGYGFMDYTDTSFPSPAPGSDYVKIAIDEPSGPYSTYIVEAASARCFQVTIGGGNEGGSITNTLLKLWEASDYSMSWGDASLCVVSDTTGKYSPLEIIWSGNLSGKTAASPVSIDLGGVWAGDCLLTLAFGGPECCIPEPGSMLAMFSGLVGLVGFGIRRRK